MKKRFLAMAMVLAAGSMLFGCSAQAPQEAQTEPSSQVTGEEPAAPSGEAVTVTFWDENAGDGRTEHYKKLIEMFEAENPDIKIEYLGLSQSEAQSKYQTAIQANETPDVGGTIDDWTAAIVQQDICYPMDEYFAASGLDEVYNEKILEIGKSMHSDGRLYYLPVTSNFNGFWINNDLFAEAGLTGAPKDWDEFFEICPKLTDAENGKYAFAIRGGSSSPSELMNLMYSYSGIENIFTEDGKCTVNDPKHVEFLKRLKDIYGVYTAESDITAGYKELVAAFDSGSAAMIYHNLGSYNTHKGAFADEASFGYYPYPMGTNGTYAYDASGTTGYVMFKTCEHPDAAWKWIEFMMSHKGNSYWNEQIGQLPVNQEALEDDWVKNAPHITTAIETINQPYAVGYVKPEYLPGYSSVNSTYLEPAVQSMLSGDMSVEELLDTWAQYYEEEYAAAQ